MPQNAKTLRRVYTVLLQASLSGQTQQLRQAIEKIESLERQLDKAAILIDSHEVLEARAELRDIRVEVDTLRHMVSPTGIPHRSDIPDAFRKQVEHIVARNKYPKSAYSLVRVRVLKVLDPWLIVPSALASEAWVRRVMAEFGAGEDVLAEVVDVHHTGCTLLGSLLPLILRRDLFKGNTLQVHHVGNIPPGYLQPGSEYWIMIGPSTRESSFIDAAQVVRRRSIV